MNTAAFAIKYRKVTYLLSILLCLVGAIAFRNLGRLDMPDFVVKTAVVATPYPGASPAEVEREVTQVIEESIQTLGNIQELYSISQEDLSIVYVEMQDRLKPTLLPQTWDELRRKISDNQHKLPPGAGPSTINDDFGDVYGLFYAITGKKPSGESYSYKELRDYAKELRKEVLLCTDVKRVEFWGEQQEVVYLKMRPTKLAELGIPFDSLLKVLQSQNIVEPSGKFYLGNDYIRITPQGDFTSVEEIGELLFTGNGGEIIRLSDIAEIKRGYLEPATTLMCVDGEPALGFGISTVNGGNAVRMTQAVEKRLEELKPMRPPGMELKTISNQGETVTIAVNDFLISLLESLVIVVVLLMVFMGWKSGILIGLVLLQTILGTFIYMWWTGITMQLVSLGALIIALGMLVDNAIVIAEGIIIGVQRGKSREEAAIETVRLNQWPLLGATIIAILAFAAIGFAPGEVGEFTSSLFWVIMASLFLSWLFAITITPVLCVDFLLIPQLSEGGDPYSHWVFKRYRSALFTTLRFRKASIFVLVSLLFVSIWAFGFIPEFFFPESDRKQFYVDYWRPQGADIQRTSEDIARIEEFLRDQEGVTQYTRFVGAGALRFILTYDLIDPNPSYGQLLISVDKRERIAELMPKLNAFLKQNFPDGETQVRQFITGAIVPYSVEARFRGPEPAVLHGLSAQAQKIMREEGAIEISDDWRQPVRVMRPKINEAKARRNGITRSDVAQAININFTGMAVGVYREGEDLLPIVLRSPDDWRKNYNDIKGIQVQSASTGKFMPLGQVVDDTDSEIFEDSLIRRRHQQKTITARCNNGPHELPSELQSRLIRRFEKEITLPEGYELLWYGEYKESNDSKEPLAMMFPICIVLMFLILVCQFNQFRPPAIIFACVPFMFIGITAGLLSSGIAFGFMAILGTLGLTGMLIKNAIVLIEQIQYNRHQLKMEAYSATVDAAVSRLRPVCMASGTTVLGILPLMWHPFYASMAATITGGLIGSTVLTLILVPLLYVQFYRIGSPRN